jgi:hypothetical protein
MPASANPRKREFYVYQFKVNDYPFYVGVGRLKRGPDRVRYVRSLLTPQNKAKLERSSLCVRVIARLIQITKDKEIIRYSQTRQPLTRAQALALEKKQIARLIRKGYLLTNWQHNPFRHQDTNTAVKAILTGQRISN